MEQPKDYGERSGLLKETDDGPNVVEVACWVSIYTLGAIFIPVTTLLVLLILKLVEINYER